MTAYLLRLLHVAVVTLLLAVILLSAAPVVRAQTAPVSLSMQAQPAFDGYFKYGEWLPVWIQLENNGPDLRGELQVRLTDSSGSAVYAAPADLPTGSRKRVPVYVLPNNFSHELLVELVNGDQLLASDTFTVQPQPNINYLVGLISPQRGALSVIVGAELPGQKRPMVLIDLSLADLPDRAEGLRSLNTLVINAVDTSSLTLEQRSALETWVRQGGRLVVGGGADAAQVLSGLPDNLRLFQPSGVEQVQVLPGLAEFTGAEQARVPGPFAVARGEYSGGRTLSQQDGLALVQELLLGRGFMDFVALDLSASPFDAWAGAQTFWEILLAPGASYPEWLPYDMSLRQTRSGSMPYALSNLPALDLPSIRGLTILLAIYILLVGPVNYLVLRWRRRLHLAWITIPAITLAFSAGAFALGYVLRGTDLILNKIAIIELQPDGNATVSSYMGLFSPAQRSYQIQVSGAGLLSPLQQQYDPWTGNPNITGEMTFMQGELGGVRGLTVNQWSMQSFMAELSWPGFGQMASDLELRGDRLVGSLRNDTAYPIKEVILLLGSQFVRLGDLAPGETKPVEMLLPTLLGQPFGTSISYKLFQEELEKPMPSGPPREIQLKQSVLDSIFPWGSWYGPIFGASSALIEPASTARLMVLGWMDQAPPDILVNGLQPVQQTTALVVQPVEYHLSKSEQLYLPPGFLSGSVVELHDAGYCGPMGMPAVYLGRQEVVFEFQVPQNLESLWGVEPTQVEIERLLLHIGTDGGWDQAPATAVFNWDTQDWKPLEGAVTGENRIEVFNGLMNADGKVRLRMSLDNFAGGGCFYLAMGLEGKR
ncbi:MAG TPA: hypothetical protein VJ436_14465 [Anaerolineales bacterium]|nr:hypothetical protein [Anaerolineales bacterium]